jgi:hypothetical protein
MKEDLNKPHWKKVIGELLSSELEEKVEKMLEQSSKININHWEFNDLGLSKMPTLEQHLK